MVRHLVSFLFSIAGKSNLKRETSNNSGGSGGAKTFFLSQFSGVPDISSTSNDNEVELVEDDAETQGVTRYAYVILYIH